MEKVEQWSKTIRRSLILFENKAGIHMHNMTILPLTLWILPVATLLPEHSNHKLLDGKKSPCCSVGQGLSHTLMSFILMWVLASLGLTLVFSFTFHHLEMWIIKLQIIIGNAITPGRPCQLSLLINAVKNCTTTLSAYLSLLIIIESNNTRANFGILANQVHRSVRLFN